MSDREPAAAERKLTAILSVDVVGYSRLMAHDGVSEEQLRSLLSSATEDFVDRLIDGLRRAGWRG